MNPEFTRPPGAPGAVPVGSIPVPKSDTKPATPDASIQPLDDVGAVHIGFWQQGWVQNVLPLMTSLLLHAGLILLALLTYKAVVKVAQVIREQIIVPTSDVVTDGEVGGVPNPGLGDDPSKT